jgi:diguanylate cyclase (GGDEF)-like protein
MAMIDISPGDAQRPVGPSSMGRALLDRVFGSIAMARRHDGELPMGNVTVNDGIRIAISIVMCAGLLVSDLVTPVEMNEVQLYPLALLPLYRVQLRYLLLAFSCLTIGLIVLGYSLAPDPNFWDGLSNRTFSIVMVVVTALSLARLATSERQLMLRALTDPLTGVFNRRTFVELSGKEAVRARRRGSLTSVLMMDIDHFKRVNDTYGHAVGDLVIKTLAEAATKSLRPTDILARYGGEEFVITLPETDAEVAHRVAERLRATFEQQVVPADGAEVRFTVSIGIVTFATGISIAEAMERADQALYRAKQNGRNRVEIAPVVAEATAQAI